MKNKIILLISLFIITGCSATYDITIDDSGINEKLIVQTESSSESKQIYNQYLPLEYEIASNLQPDIENKKFDEIEYYDSKVTSLNGFNNLQYEHKFTVDDYVKSTIINTCYPDVDYSLYQYDEKEEMSYMRIRTLKSFDCFNAENYPDKVTINITTDYEVTNNNADLIQNNTYTWVMTPQNLKQIYLIYKQPNPQPKIEEASSNISDNLTIKFFTIVGVIALIIFIIYLIIKKQSDKNNQLPS